MQFYYRINWYRKILWHKMWRCNVWGRKIWGRKVWRLKVWGTKYGAQSVDAQSMGAQSVGCKVWRRKVWGAKCWAAKYGSAKWVNPLLHLSNVVTYHSEDDLRELWIDYLLGRFSSSHVTCKYSINSCISAHKPNIFTARCDLRHITISLDDSHADMSPFRDKMDATY